MTIELRNPGRIVFEAPLQLGDTGAWVDFPYDLKEMFGKGNLVPIKAIFENSIEYRGSLAKMGGEWPMLLIKKDIQQQLNKKAGEAIHMVVELDDQPREVVLSAEFTQALDVNPKIKAIFDSLAYTHRKEYAGWIAEAKREQTRQDRIAKALRMIAAKEKLS
jgi:hypothetical protein